MIFPLLMCSGLRHKQWHQDALPIGLFGVRIAAAAMPNMKHASSVIANSMAQTIFVPSIRVLEHLRYLKQFGIGHKTVAKRAHVAKTVLAEIIWYGKKHVRRRTEAKILAIQPTLENMPLSEDVPAGETLDRLWKLIRWGYPKLLISRDAMGSANAGLQIRSLYGATDKVTVKTALKIRAFFELVTEMRRVWERQRGSIPPRHYVYWRRLCGRPPTKPTIERLELRRFARSYDVNFYPRELKQVIALKNKVRKQIGRRRHAKKQDVGFAQPFIRDSGIAEGYGDAAGC